MHIALRSSLAALALVACGACQTHDRRIYTTHYERNVRAISPNAVSTDKAALEATSPVSEPVAPPSTANPAAPGALPGPTP